MSASRRRLFAALIAITAVVTLVGTILWLVAILRPAPAPIEGIVRSGTARGGTAAFVVEIGDAADGSGFDRAGGTVLSIGRRLAMGGLGDGATPRVIDLQLVGDGGRPVMRLVFDAGVLESGAMSGGTPDHMLGLAGSGSVWPARHAPGLRAYCGRIETSLNPFCRKAIG